MLCLTHLGASSASQLDIELFLRGERHTCGSPWGISGGHQALAFISLPLQSGAQCGGVDSLVDTGDPDHYRGLWIREIRQTAKGYRISGHTTVFTPVSFHKLIPKTPPKKLISQCLGVKLQSWVSAEFFGWATEPGPVKIRLYGVKGRQASFLPCLTYAAVASVGHDPGKARRLYSHLPGCNAKLYNLLPQPEYTQSDSPQTRCEGNLRVSGTSKWGRGSLFSQEDSMGPTHHVCVSHLPEN